MNIIDYSQTSTYLSCPLKWWERYRVKRVPARTGQRDDAAAIGSLFHDGVEQWYRFKRPVITGRTLEEISPTPDAMALANMLVMGYVQQYPSEPWTLEGFEDPLLFPLHPAYEGVLDAEWKGMAKIDTYFHIDHTDSLPADDGHDLLITPGYWIQEFKTKSASISRANWMMEWETRLQASFQLLAMREKFGEDVRGMIVNVVEKPRIYIPKRKCKGCGEQYELASFLPLNDKESACPVCGYGQILSPYKPTVEPRPTFFRMKVTRTPEQLERDLMVITRIALQMDGIIGNEEGAVDPLPNLEACVDTRWGPCEYFKNHTYSLPTTEDPTMMDHNPTAYMELEKLVQLTTS